MEIILPDGSKRELEAGSTVGDVAASIGAGLAKAALCGKVDGAFADLTTEVHDGATVEIITEKSPEALGVMRHSCAHVMAEAVQTLFPGAQIAFGPETEDGFFYDFELSRSLSTDDFEAIEAQMQKIIDRDEPFVREVVTRAQAEEIFADQRFKLEHVRELPEDEEISVYRHGDFVDLCAGPHVCSAGKIGAFKLMRARTGRATPSERCCSASTARRSSRRRTWRRTSTTWRKPKSATIASLAANWASS